MRNDQSAASRTLWPGLSEPEIRLEHDKWHLQGARLQKQLHFNSFCHFHLISSVSRPQRLLIYDCIYFSSPTPPPPGANISWKNFLAALFIPKVPLETGAPPPQLFDASYAPDYYKF
jgi:hypothetical protein